MLGLIFHRKGVCIECFKMHYSAAKSLRFVLLSDGGAITHATTRGFYHSAITNQLWNFVDKFYGFQLHQANYYIIIFNIGSCYKKLKKNLVAINFLYFCLSFVVFFLMPGNIMFLFLEK